MDDKMHLVAGGETPNRGTGSLEDDATRALAVDVGADIPLEGAVVAASDHLTLDFLGRPGPVAVGLAAEPSVGDGDPPAAATDDDDEPMRKFDVRTGG